MSGIYGMVRYDGAPVTKEELTPIAAAMSIWGQDGHGQWSGDCAGLGHFMLHVTPESLHERLPAGIRVAPHLIITADARIDNRDELFDALGVPGQGRGQTPDSSLILLAYERWGPECVKRLLGDFAFAIWNTRERTLFCARDPIGSMPFVYCYENNRFIFASDVKGVLAALDRPRLNEPLLAAYLQMATYYAEKTLTFFEGVVKLPPGHWTMVTSSDLKTTRYWSPEDAPAVRLASDADYTEQMEYLFRQSVECRLRSAFPIGSHLSGGLDSSATSIMASRMLHDRGQDLAVFSWSPPPEPANPLYSEGEYARIDAVCRQEGLRCEYVPVTTARLTATFEKDFTTEPMAMMARESNVQTRANALGLRVILSGWGGDEIATCRASTGPAEFLARGEWAEFKRAFRVRLSTPDSRGLPTSRMRRVGGIARDFVTSRLPDSLYGLVAEDPFMMHKASCLQKAISRLYRREIAALRGPAFRRLPSVRARIARLLDIGHIPYRMEHWAGSGARNGLVYRYPMVDKRLVEFALGIPPTMCPTDRRRSLFLLATGGILPSNAGWDRAKTEDATIRALKKEYFKAHSDWARHLAPQMVNSTALRFVDPAKIRKAVQTVAQSGGMADLAGVREAFGIFAIPFGNFTMPL